MIEHRWQLWLVCWGAAAVLLAVLYVRQRRIAWLVLGRTRGHADEDTRYRELRRRRRARGREQLSFAIFYQAQALLAAVLGTVFVLAVFAEGALGALAWAGAVVWLAAASLELCADAQHRRFKADPA